MASKPETINIRIAIIHGQGTEPITVTQGDNSPITINQVIQLRNEISELRSELDRLRKLIETNLERPILI